jgi:hypothetical protein
MHVILRDVTFRRQMTLSIPELDAFQRELEEELHQQVSPLWKKMYVDWG